MAEEKEILFQVRKKDLRIDTFRAGGKGGQHQNKTDSGVRITHIETGISAECRSHKSQHANRKEAFNKLADLLLKHYVEQDNRERYAAGAEVVRTYHEPDDRVTCHATGRQYSYRQTIGKGKVEEMLRDRLIHFILEEK